VGSAGLVRMLLSAKNASATNNPFVCRQYDHNYIVYSTSWHTSSRRFSKMSTMRHRAKLWLCRDSVLANRHRCFVLLRPVVTESWR